MLNLKTEKRDIYGKNLKKERAKGKIPAVLYGPKEKSASIFIDEKDFESVWKKAGESQVISLNVSGDEKDALIHDVVQDPVSEKPIHADFFIIEKGKEITVSIPLEFIGESQAVKNLGGTLVKVLHEIEIKVLPRNLPPHINVNIEGLLDLDSQILAKDLKLPEGVAITENADEVVAAISVAKEEEEETSPVDIESIEVEKKGKQEEEDESKDGKDSGKSEPDKDS